MRQKIVAVADDALLAMQLPGCIERGHGLRELFGKRIQVLAGIADAGPAVLFFQKDIELLEVGFCEDGIRLCIEDGYQESFIVYDGIPCQKVLEHPL